MKTKTFYSVWCLIFLLGAVWNILCITAILPLKLYYLSLIVFLNVASIIMNFCKAKQDTHKRDDKIKNPLLYLFPCLAAAWLITFVACVFAA